MIKLHLRKKKVRAFLGIFLVLGVVLGLYFLDSNGIINITGAFVSTNEEVLNEDLVENTVEDTESSEENKDEVNEDNVVEEDSSSNNGDSSVVKEVESYYLEIDDSADEVIQPSELAWILSSDSEFNTGTYEDTEANSDNVQLVTGFLFGKYSNVLDLANIAWQSLSFTTSFSSGALPNDKVAEGNTLLLHLDSDVVEDTSGSGLSVYSKYSKPINVVSGVQGNALELGDYNSFIVDESFDLTNGFSLEYWANAQGNTDYKYERRIDFTEPIPFEDYIINIVLEDIDYTHFKGDGSDLQIISGNNKDSLEFWVEEWNIDGKSSIWVKVEHKDMGYMILMYGNENALDRRRTADFLFPFYEDFESYESQADGELPDGWESYDSGSFVLGTDGSRFGIKEADSNEDSGAFIDLGTEQTSFQLKFDVKPTTEADDSGLFGILELNSLTQVSLVDNAFNGYGFLMNTLQISLDPADPFNTYYGISKKTSGETETTLLNVEEELSSDIWYSVELTKIDNEIEVKIYDNGGNLIIADSTSDLTYDSFTHLFLNGKQEYHIDNILLIPQANDNNPQAIVGEEKVYGVTLGEDIGMGLIDGEAYAEVGDINIIAPLSESWNHLALTYNAVTSEMTFFVNGAEVYKETVTTSVTTNGEPLQIGSNPEALILMDELAFYEKTLTSEEVLAHYQSTATNLALSYKLCETAACDLGEGWVTAEELTSLTGLSGEHIEIEVEFSSIHESISPILEEVKVVYTS